MSIMNVSEPLQIDRCPACGVLFGIPVGLLELQSRERAAGRKKKLCCPNGHRIVYGDAPAEKSEDDKTEILKLRHENEQLEAEISTLRNK